MAMPVGTESTQVSLNLVSVPQPVPQSPAVQESEPTTSPVPKPKPVVKETTVKKLVKKKNPEVMKEKPTPKVVKTTVNKTVKKVTKVPPKHTETKPVTESKPEVKTQAAAGVNNSPKLITKPTFSTRPSPVKYPRLAKLRGIEGQVTVEVWIDPKGKQVKHTLVKSSGAQVLDKAALKAIKRWRFSSHIVDGQAIAHRVQIPVRFKLD